MDLTKLMEEDISPSKNSVDNLNHEGLKSVAEVAKNIRDKEELISQLEEKLSSEKKSLLKLTDEDLPGMFIELGLNKLELDDGSTVEVKQTYGASIRVDNRPAAYDWLRDHDYDDIIKNTVACSFGKGEDDIAKQFSEFALTQGFDAQTKTEVHPQTLRAFIKERVESGDEFPMELFGAWVGQRATIKLKKGNN
jgi:hypothetical protein|tara:strand:+ start:1036 stop:1617 length:582 start_codon:yes stop_codon:yes gene_type:complete